MDYHSLFLSASFAVLAPGAHGPNFYDNRNADVGERNNAGTFLHLSEDETPSELHPFSRQHCDKANTYNQGIYHRVCQTNLLW